MRSVYIISDLHLGGDYPAPPGPGKRGFRLCTCADAVAQFVTEITGKITEKGSIELVLNGDTVDFLAETDGKPDTWLPFTMDPDRAVAKLEAVVKRDQQIFDALNGFLEKRGRLVVLLGNHDIELSLPAVRAAFRRALGVKGCHDFEFLYDGEAYIVGDALIEHGNRYDAWNQIDYGALRRIRSFQSRRQPVPEEYALVPPAGSELVTSVINTIKRDYAFVDLLKPETSAVVPILLALEPGYRSRLGTIALLYNRQRQHGLASADQPRMADDISADLVADSLQVEDIHGGGDIGSSSEEDVALERVVRDALGADAASFLGEIKAQTGSTELGEIGVDIGASDTISRAWGFASLLFAKKSETYEKRLPALLKAMRGIQNTDTFDVGTEHATEYLNAANKLSGRGFRYVVFGHTHQAKRVKLDNGGFYLNSGTWADILRFPNEILKSEAEALPALQAFVAQLKAGDFSRWTLFRPTYVHLIIDDVNKVAEAKLEDFAWTTQR